MEELDARPMPLLDRPLVHLPPLDLPLLEEEGQVHLHLPLLQVQEAQEVHHHHHLILLSSGASMGSVSSQRTEHSAIALATQRACHCRRHRRPCQGNMHARRATVRLVLWAISLVLNALKHVNLLHQIHLHVMRACLKNANLLAPATCR